MDNWLPATEWSCSNYLWQRETAATIIGRIMQQQKSTPELIIQRDTEVLIIGRTRFNISSTSEHYLGNNHSHSNDDQMNQSQWLSTAMIIDNDTFSYQIKLGEIIQTLWRLEVPKLPKIEKYYETKKLRYCTDRYRFGFFHTDTVITIYLTTEIYSVCMSASTTKRLVG